MYVCLCVCVCVGGACICVCIHVCNCVGVYFAGRVSSTIDVRRRGRWMGVEMGNGGDSVSSPVLLDGGSSAQSSASN